MTAAPKAFIDFESSSTVDLRRTGSSRYAQDATTRILCLAWAIDHDPVDIWQPETRRIPAQLHDHILHGGEVHAFNAGFEIDIWTHTLSHLHPGIIQPRPEQWFCTQARAVYWGLPANLADACLIARTTHQIDPGKNARMLRMARPRGLAADGTPRWWDREEPERLDELMVDCVNDVEAERELHFSLPDPPARERKIWLLDRKMNRRGIAVDLTLARKLQNLAMLAKDDANQELRKVTGGAVGRATQTADLLAFVRQTMPEVENLRRETLDDLVGNLALPSDDPALRALQLRREVANASPAKIDAMFAAVDPDGRVRGSLKYYGAARTGRWSGAGGTKVQLQNLPRGTISNIPLAIDLILKNTPAGHLDMLFEGSTMGIVASCLRGCFIAGPGEQMIAMDFSQIEARVIAWLAGQQDLLDVFRNSEDVYVYAAKRIGSTSRLLGKIVTLALGYGMGWMKFIATAKTYGLIIDESFARQTVTAWRSSNSEIVQYWYGLENAFRDAIQSPPGKEIIFGCLALRRGLAGVAIELPSGRLLVYRDVRLVDEDPAFRPSIVYAGIHQKTKQWDTTIRTYSGKLCENVTQAIARDVMADALLLADNAGLDLALSNHDEVIALALAPGTSVARVVLSHIMNTPPPWAPGLPVAAAGWIGSRYQK